MQPPLTTDRRHAPRDVGLQDLTPNLDRFDRGMTGEVESRRVGVCTHDHVPTDFFSHGFTAAHRTLFDCKA